MARDRRQSRILAMQALCQWEVQQDATPEALADFFDAREAEADDARYATRLVQGYLNERDRIDKSIAQAAIGWDLARISLVERNVMRVALVELGGDEVPPKVVLNEAIEISREYGGKDSPRFVNGILDEIHKRKKREPKDDN